MLPYPVVLFAGDLNIDLVLTGIERPIAPGREVFCTGKRKTLGGSTAIAAAAYARLGGRSLLAARMGRDADGDFLISRLDAAGVDHSLVGRDEAMDTGTTVNLVEGNGRTQVTYPGALANFAAGPELLDREPRPRHLHISGPYVQAGLRPGLTRLFRAAKERGISVSLDTQWDPAGTWDGLDEWLPLLDFLFVNEDEARAISGRDDVESSLAALSDRTTWPIVKLGGEGCLSPLGRTPAPRVPVVDTTGAGDSFAAGFLAGLYVEGLGRDEALRYATAVGALACTWTGGDSSEMQRDRAWAMMA